MDNWDTVLTVDNDEIKIQDKNGEFKYKTEDGIPNFYFTALLWTSFFTVGLATSMRSKNTASNKMHMPLRGEK